MKEYRLQDLKTNKLAKSTIKLTESEARIFNHAFALNKVDYKYVLVSKRKQK